MNSTASAFERSCWFLFHILHCIDVEYCTEGACFGPHCQKKGGLGMASRPEAASVELTAGWGVYVSHTLMFEQVEAHSE